MAAKYIVMRRIEPQPNLPIVSFFHSDDHDNDDAENRSGWMYQYRLCDPEFPDISFNATAWIADPKQPGRPGELYEGALIEKVKIVMTLGEAYWEVSLIKGERWLTYGHVVSVYPERRKILIWLSCFHDLELVDIVPSMPAWLLVDGAGFYTSVPRDIVRSDDFSGNLDWGRFDPMDDTDKDESALLEEICEIARSNQ